MRAPRSTYRFPLTLATAALATALGACAGAANPMQPPDRILVRVHNNTVPSSSVTVYLLPVQGNRALLGTVDPGATETFRDEPEPASTRFRLMARTTEGGVRRSRSFDMTGLDGAEWSLSTNDITLYEATRVPEADTAGADAPVVRPEGSDVEKPDDALSAPPGSRSAEPSGFLR